MNHGTALQVGTVNGDVNVAPGSRELDTALLRAETEANLDLMARHLSLPSPEGGVTVERALFPELVRAEQGFLLTGEPGIGKTALMRGLARHYRDRGQDVVLLDAGSFAGHVAGKLARSLHTVLREWTGEEPAHLMIDSLDGERGEALGWLSDIVARLDGTRWRVVASARLYDISHNERWKTAFKGTPVSSDPRHRVEALKGVRHFLADGFTAAELEDAAGRIPGLGTVLAQAAPPFRELLANPFNLYLTCDLLAEGTWDQGAAEPSDQLVLLERYWGARVANDGGLDRIRLLKDVCSLMLDRRRLQISAADLPSGHGEAMAELSGNGVLRPIPSRYAHAVPSVAFPHHILFDYAVAQLVFVGEEGSVLAELLDAEPNLVFIARPAIDLHLAQTWDIDPTREEFARLFRRLVRSENILVGVAAAAVVVVRSRSEADIAWLTSEEAPGDAEGIGLVIGVLGEDTGGEPHIRKRSVEIWTSMAVVLAERLDGGFRPRTVNLLQRILRTLDGLEPLSPDAVRAHERASCVAALMTTALEDTAGRARLAAAASQSLPVAVAVDSGHGDLVRRIMHDPHTREHNPDVFYWCVVGAADIAHAAPAIAAELVETVWGLTGDRNEMTPLLTGVLSLSSNLEQDFTRVRYQVGEVFPRLIPLIGIEAACRVLATATREAYFTEAEKQCRYRLLAEGEEGLVLVGLASLRHSGGYGAAGNMTDALLDWAERTGVDGTHTTVRFLVRHVRHPDVWNRTMIRMRERVDLWSTAAVILLSSGGLLANTVTRREAAALLGAVSPKATDDEHRCLEEAVEAAAETAAPDGGPDLLRVLDELVLYLGGTRLTNPSLAERREIVDHLDEPPEVSSWKITTGFRSLTPQEKFGEDVCAQLGPERLVLVERLDGLRARSEAERDEAWLAELIELLSEALRDRSLMERMFPDRDDPAAEVVVGAARALAGSGGVAPETELGRRICEVFRQVIGSASGREGESP
ncbi:AAA family ATPase [Nocardiopsis dassonvillei]|uniref:AAA family ATPase n=1 Tax=Nocardiopsis dassonvillei TaxID=2014 RepID=UPI003F56A778